MKTLVTTCSTLPLRLRQPNPSTRYMIFRFDGEHPPRRTPPSNALFLGSACLHRQHGPNTPFSPTSLMPTHPVFPCPFSPSSFVPHSSALLTPEHYVARSLFFLPTFRAHILLCPSNSLLPPLTNTLSPSQLGTAFRPSK